VPGGRWRKKSKNLRDIGGKGTGKFEKLYLIGVCRGVSRVRYEKWIGRRGNMWFRVRARRMAACFHDPRKRL